MSDFAAALTHAGQQVLVLERQKLTATVMALDDWGAGTEAAMRQDAVWIDRSGEARARLQVVPAHPDLLQGAEVTLVHAAAHGIFLELPPGKRRPPQPVSVAQVIQAGGAVAELAGGSKYAIVQPTFGRRWPLLYDAMREIWR